MRNDNPYLEQVHQALPRVLGAFDTNPASGTHGLGDRYRWGWKLIDFTNAKFQGAVHGLSILIEYDLLPDYLSEEAALSYIDAAFEGLKTIIEKNGSVCEAFPNEYSYGLTAFVANDMLSSVFYLEKHIDEDTRARYLDIVRPMIGFLQQADEAHGVICNHLAGAVAAMTRWELLEWTTLEKRKELTEKIYNNFSEEGWFLEYEGADPGYQSLCLGYLADVYIQDPDDRMKETLGKAFEFLSYFAHPDGSFGGVYAARNTRFLAPAAIEALAEDYPVAASLARFARQSVKDMRFVTLASIDAHNMTPFFNNFCKAAALYIDKIDMSGALPYEHSEPFQKHFKEAGLVIDKGSHHYTIVSTHKGGVVYHFHDGKAYIDAGVLMRDGKNRKVSTQGYNPQNKSNIDGEIVAVMSEFTSVNNTLPTPFQFFVLRFLNMTVMRSRALGNAVKKALVQLLITRKNRAGATNKRVITLGKDLNIEDTQSNAQEYERVLVDGAFSAIHMASQGYWQRQDTAND